MIQIPIRIQAPDYDPDLIQYWNCHSFDCTLWLCTTSTTRSLLHVHSQAIHFLPLHLSLTGLLSLSALLGGGPKIVVSTAAFHARVRGSVPGLGGLKETKMFLPHPRVKVSIVGSLRDREVACSASDRQGSNFESCVWRTVSSQSSHHPQEVLLAQFSLYVHKGGLKPDSFHFISTPLTNFQNFTYNTLPLPIKPLTFTLLTSVLTSPKEILATADFKDIKMWVPFYYYIIFLSSNLLIHSGFIKIPISCQNSVILKFIRLVFLDCLKTINLYRSSVLLLVL